MSEPSPIPPGLGWRRRLARCVLWFERVLPALLPAARVLGIFLCVALLDLLPLLPWWLHAAALAATAVAIVVLLWRGLARIVPPDAIAADRRLEPLFCLRAGQLIRANAPILPSLSPA